MNTAFLVEGLLKAQKVLELAGLFKNRNMIKPLQFSLGKFSAAFLGVFQGKDYVTIFDKAMENADYDLLLSDFSFFQFSYAGTDEGTKIRYAFYEAPRRYPTYEEFLRVYGFDSKECGDCFDSEYEQAIIEARLKTSVVPVRYDCGPTHKALEHPYCHIHVGFDNEVRIPLSRSLTPQAFVAFTVRQVYREAWIEALKDEEFRKLYQEVKVGCPSFDRDFFTDIDRADFYIA